MDLFILENTEKLGLQIQPHVTSGRERIDRIRELMAAESGAVETALRDKVDLLENWQKRAGKALPLILKFIGG